jgi:hypothetical protein
VDTSRIRIVSDGTTAGTKVLLVGDDGSETVLPGVSSFAIDGHAEARDNIQALIVFRDVELDIAADADVFGCQACLDRYGSPAVAAIVPVSDSEAAE